MVGKSRAIAPCDKHGGCKLDLTLPRQRPDEPDQRGSKEILERSSPLTLAVAEELVEEMQLKIVSRHGQ